MSGNPRRRRPRTCTSPPPRRMSSTPRTRSASRPASRKRTARWKRASVASARDGVGLSSAMAHKRNPVGCMHALAAAARAPGLIATLHAAALGEHERALGGWQAELAVVPELAGLLGTSLDFLEILGAGLV